MAGSRVLRISVATAALILPCVAVFCVPLFNVIEPRVFGIPFFYAYQLAWVPISAGCIALAYAAYNPLSESDER